VGTDSADCINVTADDIYIVTTWLCTVATVWSGAECNRRCMERGLSVLMLTELRGIFSGVVRSINVRGEQ
jgi:hypothetical protein